MKIKEMKGITLIALVITIIVLLILASVSIAMLTSENGIIKQALHAKEEIKQAELKEILQLEIINLKQNYDLLDSDSKPILQENLLKTYNNLQFKNFDNDLEVSSDNIKYLITEDLTIIEKVEGDPNLWEYKNNKRKITKYIGENLNDINEIIIPNYINGTWINTLSGTQTSTEHSSIFGEENTNISKVTISEGIVLLGSSAFRYCKELREIQFPNSLQRIEWGVFYNCTALTSDITLPDNVTYIGQCSFDGCSGLNGTLRIGSNIEKIDTYAFAGCHFESVIINANKDNVIINPGQCFKTDDIIWLK